MDTVHTWIVSLHVFEHDDTTSVDAVLKTEAGMLHGKGTARKNPKDANVPEIGDEVAAARALRDLADRLLGLASDDIAEAQHEVVHLRR